MLVYYDPSLPLRVATDASSIGLGAILSHVMPDGVEGPVNFASRTLSTSEKKYAQVEKKALGLIFTGKKFHPYLYSRKLTLLTDHKSLTTILGPKNAVPALAAARLQRWALLLSAYLYDIQYKSSDKHTCSNADGLSRLSLPVCDSLTSSVLSSFYISQIPALTVTSTHIQRATRRDLILSKVLLYTRKGWPSSVPDEFKPFHCRKHELMVEQNCLLWGTRIIIPKSLRATILEELHQNHPGIVRMKILARSYLWSPKLDHEIEKQVKCCESCQCVKGHPSPTPLHPWFWPSRPWQRIHLDFAGPFFKKDVPDLC